MGGDKSKDLGGRIVFVILLLVIPAGVFYSLLVLTNVVAENPDPSITHISVGRSSVITTTQQTLTGIITTTTAYATPAPRAAGGDEGPSRMSGNQGEWV